MKSPAFQFYAAEFLVDENVVLMSNQEVGCYIKLMAYCWREGSIPSSIEKIAKLCGEDGSAMAQLWLAISSCFTNSLADPSRLVHQRLEVERKKQEDHRKERSESGKKGAKVKWGGASKADSLANGSATKQPIAKDSSSSSSSSSVNLSTANAVEVASKLPPCPHQEIISLYHATLPMLPQVREWNDQRQGYMRSRWKDHPSLDYWQKFFAFVAKSEFLTGRAEGRPGAPPFVADLEWLIRPTNFVKVIEGKYHQERVAA